MSSDAMHRGQRGQLLIISAPSGGGKTSLVNALLKADPALKLSVSHTTRPPRGSETEGVQYHFVSESEFLAMVEEQAFVEHAQVFDHHYGTHHDQLKNKLDRGLDVILEIDWQGARQVRERFPESRSIFILPPSLDVLQQRLAGRATDSETVVKRRMRDAQSEISHWAEYDYLVVNDQFDLALGNLQSIIVSGRLVRERQNARLTNLLAELLGKR